ncbi:MAG: AraC family transcriptional regulator [Clostridia bacterium]
MSYSVVAVRGVCSAYIPFDIDIYNYGYDLVLPNGYVNGPLVRDHYAIHCCTTGRGVYVCQGVEFPIERGQCFVTFPELVLWLSLSGNKVSSYFKQLGLSVSNPIFPWRFNNHIENCMQEIISAGRIRSVASELNQLSSITALFLEFFHLNGLSSDEPPDNNSQERYVYSAARYMDMNYDKDLKISDVANHVGLNRSYLFSVFKKHRGMSPQDYLISLRIKKACDFLKYPQATVSNVAFSVGYDPLTFSKIFKRIIGVPPSEYRKKYIMHD